MVLSLRSALPALALGNGVPASLRTLVAVPTLLTTRAEIAELVERFRTAALRGSTARPTMGSLLSHLTTSRQANPPAPARE